MLLFAGEFSSLCSLRSFAQPVVIRRSAAGDLGERLTATIFARSELNRGPLGEVFLPRASIDKGFAVPPKRWIVEHTIAWLNRCGRLAKDIENLNRNKLAVLRLASIRRTLRKICNP